MSLVRKIKITMPNGEEKTFECGRIAYTDNDLINARIAELYYEGGDYNGWTFFFYAGSWLLMINGNQYSLRNGFNHLQTSVGEVYIIWDGDTTSIEGGEANVYSDIAHRLSNSPACAAYVGVQQMMATMATPYTDNDILNNNIAELYVSLSGSEIQSLGASSYIRQIRYEYQGYPVFYFDLYNGSTKTLRIQQHLYTTRMHSVDNIYIIPRMLSPETVGSITAAITTTPNYTQIAGYSPGITAYLAMKEEITTVLNTSV